VVRRVQGRDGGRRLQGAGRWAAAAGWDGGCIGRHKGSGRLYLRVPFLVGDRRPVEIDTRERFL